jgi:hypothetical protein
MLPQARHVKGIARHSARGRAHRVRLVVNMKRGAGGLNNTYGTIAAGFRTGAFLAGLADISLMLQMGRANHPSYG